MLVIAISGKRGVGKSSLEKRIADLYPYKMYYQSTSFATPLKEVVSLLFGYSMADLDDQEFKSRLDERYNISPRTVLQTLGTDFFRKQVSENFWVDRMQDTLEMAKASGVKLMVVPDVRFQNEVELLQKYNAFFVKVESPAPAFDYHDSETQKLEVDWDMVVHNDGSDFGILADAASEILENFKESLTPPSYL